MDIGLLQLGSLQDDQLCEDFEQTNPPSNADDAMILVPTNSESKTSPILDEPSLTETTGNLIRTVPTDLTSGDQFDMLHTTSVFPCSSPVNEPTSSPTAHSSSPLPSSDIRSLLDQATSSPQSEHPSFQTNVSDPVYGPDNAARNVATSIPSSNSICSSPPSSSPESVFSSSPQVASDSSVHLEDLDFAADKSELDTRMPVDGTDLTPPTSSPWHSSFPMAPPVDDALNQDHLNGPPPSSSPCPSYPQSMEQQLSPETDAVANFGPGVEPCLVPQPVEQQPSLELDAIDSYPAVLLNPAELEPSETPPEIKDATLQTASIGPPSDPMSGGIQVPQTVVSEPVDIFAEGSGQNNDLQPSNKRKREEAKSNFEKGEELNEENQTTTQPPNPKRPTLASQKLQRRTLAKPFRSPAMKRPITPESAPPPPPKETTSIERSAIDPEAKKKHRTQRAAGQFKSPLSLAASASLPSSVRQTPTIQALEHKVQVLKRAVKVKKDGEEETLQGLVKKWTEAGREVAWEVWELVKDNDSGGGDDWGKDSCESGLGKRKLEDSWGWNEGSGGKKTKVEETERNWGWDVSPTTGNDDHSTEQRVETIDEEEKPRETLGTMLMRLGIAPATLGWNDDEGEFVDE
ncbi:hypothetical protein DFH07DRAFT_124765 [Mycena maculata]|uniref:Uncharacterized protein n=1 Tax=Mycena maculata TaxID=230809 RepID=A0AAD7K0G6_9AGAR|nr:hypothetical protein DFH07DRAFT_124765 [Mycena maculata]